MLEAIETLYVVVTWELRDGYHWEVTEQMHFLDREDAGHYKWEAEEYYKDKDGIKFTLTTTLAYRYED